MILWRELRETDMNDDHNPSPPSVAGMAPSHLPPLKEPVPSGSSATGSSLPHLSTVMRLPIQIKVVIGSATMSVAELSRLAPGDVVALDQKIGDKVDIVANGRTIARGEIVVIDGEGSHFGVRVDDVVTGKSIF